jgi:hypothetical protein
LTVTVGGKTAEYTVEIKEAVGPPVTATSLIETAIANFVPVRAKELSLVLFPVSKSPVT